MVGDVIDTRQVAAIPSVVKLSAADLFAALWRKPEPLHRPGPREFELQKSFLLLRKMPRNLYDWQELWYQTREPDLWSQEECHFWLCALLEMFDAQREFDQKRLVIGAVEQQLQQINFSCKPAKKDIRRALRNLGDIALIPLLLIHSPIAASVLGAQPEISPPAFASAFRKFVLPYLTADELRSISDEVRSQVANSSGSNSWSEGNLSVPFAYFLASAVGLSDLVTPVIQRLPDQLQSACSFWYSAGIKELLWGLGGADSVQAEFQRLELNIWTAEDIRCWLAHTGTNCVNRLNESVLGARSKAEATAKIEVAALIEAPEIAPYMVQWYLRSLAPTVALNWLKRFPHYALPYLNELVRKPEHREQAVLLARDLFLESELQQIAPHMVSALHKIQAIHGACETESERATDAPLWLAEGLVREPRDRSKIPAWVNFQSLSNIVIQGYECGLEQTKAILLSLKRCTSGDAPLLIRTLRNNIRAGELDWFLREVFDMWSAAGEPSKDKWILYAMGWIGSDRLVSSLVPFMFKWRANGLYSRSASVLDCLRLRDTNICLSRLNEIAETENIGALRIRASEMLDQIAHIRGLAREELEDSIISGYGLNSGQTVFDYGGRKFTAYIDTDMKLFIRDQQGLARQDLPAPCSKDDQTMAARALFEWRSLKRDLKAFKRLQSIRLERAMIDARAWSFNEFKVLFVEHPVMAHFARAIVWAAYDRDGLRSCFRTTDEHEFADMYERQFNIEQYTHFRIVHPLYLTAEQIESWGQIFTDYALIQPFAQLKRAVMHPTRKELRSKFIDRFGDVEVPAVSLLSIFEKAGWLRGAINEDGVSEFHIKSFAGAGLSAVAEYTGIIAGAPYQSEDQAIRRCYFLPGKVKIDSMISSADAVPLSKVDRVVLSEVLCDLSAVY